MARTDDLTLRIGGQELGGWTAVRVTRGVERLVSDFDIMATSRYKAANQLEVSPGDACQVLLGDDLAVTGYVDDLIPEVGPQGHTVRIAGRSRTCDLVDCAAVWPGSQIVNGTILRIAQDLAKPFGITVDSQAADVGPNVPITILNWGDTPFDLLEPMARLRALLMYDNPDGQLVLANLGKTLITDGIFEGVNVEAAAAAYSMRNRYSDVRVFRTKLNAFRDPGNESSFAADFSDETVPRYRPKFMVAETGDGGIDVAAMRAQWTIARAVGRSAAVHVRVTGWRDGDGLLWTPNTLAQVRLPSLKLPEVTWLISEVTYHADANSGRTTEMVLMHPESFIPQPINYQPIPKDLQDAINQSLAKRGLQ